MAKTPNEITQAQNAIISWLYLAQIFGTTADGKTIWARLFPFGATYLPQPSGFT
jgi:hypothetical protein